MSSPPLEPAEIVILVVMIGGYLIGLHLIAKHIKKGILGSDKPLPKDCTKGHTWKSIETYQNSGIEYLRCEVCKKTLDQILKG